MDIWKKLQFTTSLDDKILNGQTYVAHKLPRIQIFSGFITQCLWTVGQIVESWKHFGNEVKTFSGEVELWEHLRHVWAFLTQASNWCALILLSIKNNLIFGAIMDGHQQHTQY